MPPESSLVTAILLASRSPSLSGLDWAPAADGTRCALGAIPAVDAAVALVNRAVSLGFNATRLPALALAERHSR
jgi:cyclic beta-1,2-glucan synthetase